jgi:hypothetical protein
VRIVAIPLQYVEAFEEALFVPEYAVERIREAEKGLWPLSSVSLPADKAWGTQSSKYFTRCTPSISRIDSQCTLNWFFDAMHICQWHARHHWAVRQCAGRD